VPVHIEVLFEQYGMHSIPNLDLSRLEIEWKHFTSSIPEPWKLNTDGREFKVGEAAAARGFSMKHPTILVPGIVSTV
jgi:phospholipid:diacylglycerol acyltransferase